MSTDAQVLKKTKASYESILVDADFAVLVLLKRSNTRGTTYFFASAIADEDGQIEKYLVVSATRETTQDYFLGRSDLHFVYVYAPSVQYYEADASAIFEKDIELRPFLGRICDDYIPSKGFFARDHNRDYSFVKQPPSTHEIPIDGQWKMKEFKEFYSRYSDVYVFHEAVINLQNTQASVAPVNYVSAFRDKPFRGGSSYLGFFNDLKSVLPYHERPHLAAVQWASPGKITVKGSRNLFDAVDNQIRQFENTYDEARENYKKLREYMKSKGWLEITADSYSSPSSTEETELFKLIDVLVSALHIPGGRSFTGIIEGNQIVEAKIFLAIFRRLETLLKFVREGRVSVS